MTDGFRENERAADSLLRLPSAVLWDMDGTLVDTEPAWIAAETALVASFGGEWSTEDALSLVGNPLDRSAHILQQAGVKLSTDEIIHTLMRQVIDQVSVDVPWCEGALELLGAIRSWGVPCALVTMSHMPLVQAVVSKLPLGAFDVLVTGDMVVRGKPDPEAYRTAVHRLAVDSQRCVAIEDSVPGVNSAIGAGIATIGVQRHVPLPDHAGLYRVQSLSNVTIGTLQQLIADPMNSLSFDSSRLGGGRRNP